VKQYVLTLLLIILSYGIGANIGSQKNLDTPSDTKWDIAPVVVAAHNSENDVIKDAHINRSKPSNNEHTNKTNELKALLDEKSKQIKLMQAEIERMQEPTRRLGYLMKGYEEFGSFDPLVPRLGDDFQPNHKMADFFGLSDDELKTMQFSAEKALAQVKDWEIINALLIVKEESLTVYDMPIGDEMLIGIKSTFLDELTKVLGNEDIPIIRKMVNNLFFEFSVRRELRYSPLGEELVTKYHRGIISKFTIIAYEGDKRGNMVGSPILPERYLHLF